MRTYSIILLIVALIYAIHSISAVKVSRLRISLQEAKKIGYQIWYNECGRNLDKIIFWNPNEGFPSLGIGHNIWGENIPFKQSFPGLVKFMAERGKPLPLGITSNIMACPWKTRDEFMAQQNSQRMKLLRAYLESTIDLQIQYMIEKLERQMPKILESVSALERKQIQTCFELLSKLPMGRYALIDYLNFKGAGLEPKEAYKLQGWGLKQVLMRMPCVTKDLVRAFAQAAREVLEARIKNDSSGKEKRWLEGWLKRISTYELPSLATI